MCEQSLQPKWLVWCHNGVMRLGSVSEQASPRERARTIVASVCLLLFASFSTLPDLFFFLLAHSCPTSLKDILYIVCVGGLPPPHYHVVYHTATGRKRFRNRWPSWSPAPSPILNTCAPYSHLVSYFWSWGKQALLSIMHLGVFGTMQVIEKGGKSFKHLCCTMTEN